ncbi:MAG: hypothetical protein QM750_03920 [Rubrivivax sp.]
MSTETQIRIPARMHALAATAMLLERLEHTPRGASAAQYRSVVRQLGSLLDEAADEPALPALLDGLPGLSRAAREPPLRRSGPVPAAAGARGAGRAVRPRIAGPAAPAGLKQPSA